MGKLDGKAALVTGGGRGIGRGIVLELAREGADVAINFRRGREQAEATARDVEALGRRAVLVQADVGDLAEVERGVEEAVRAFGRLDVAVANSGVASRPALVKDMELAEWRRVLATDLDGAFFTARTTLAHLEASRGTLVFISSIGADAAAAGGAPYYVAKAGVNVLTKVVAREMAPAGVRVNCVAPGLVRSDMGDRMIKALGDVLIQGIPLGRAGEPADIGRAVVFLASDDAAWITGKILRVDGGAWM
jgi:3-oxoacyl-[acyl-carrier protein] reductase